MSNKFTLKTKDHDPLELEKGVNLSKQLDATNSPILFGCRTGICGTCIVNVIEGHEHLNSPSEDESELLEIMAENLNAPRLACQLNCQGDLSVEYFGKS